jgi:DNA-binding IclR family transcriptional regulator
MATQRHNPSAPTWTFFTNHSHVLLCIAEDPEARMRDMAARVGITERAVQRIIDDLAEAGYLVVEREGRRNRYQIVDKLPLRHPVEAHCKVGGLIGLVLSKRAVEAGR